MFSSGTQKKEREEVFILSLFFLFLSFSFFLLPPVLRVSKSKKPSHAKERECLFLFYEMAGRSVG